jgi:hypothetical protein
MTDNPFIQELDKWQNNITALKQQQEKAEATVLLRQLSEGGNTEPLQSNDKRLSKAEYYARKFPNNPKCACGCVLVKRTNHKNNSEFWGCSNYPECRGTRNIVNR